MNKKYFTYFLMFFLLSACGVFPSRETPTPTEIFEFVDGMARANVFTWEDVNRNGVPDKGEPPLPYVTTSVGYYDFLTATNGRVKWKEFKPGCAKDCADGITLSVKVPPGYTPTTPTSYILEEDEGDYRFGFYSLNDNKDLPFPDEPAWQKAFINRGAKILAFHYSNIGIVEITMDRDSTVVDDFYPESSLTDEFYFNIFIFDVVSDLSDRYIGNINGVQITLMPNKSTFLCKNSIIEEWRFQVSGYEIITEHCERK